MWCTARLTHTHTHTHVHTHTHTHTPHAPGSHHTPTHQQQMIGRGPGTPNTSGPPLTNPVGSPNPTASQKAAAAGPHITGLGAPLPAPASQQAQGGGGGGGGGGGSGGGLLQQYKAQQQQVQQQQQAGGALDDRAHPKATPPHLFPSPSPARPEQAAADARQQQLHQAPAAQKAAAAAAATSKQPSAGPGTLCGVCVCVCVATCNCTLCPLPKFSVLNPGCGLGLLLGGTNTPRGVNPMIRCCL